MPFELRDLGLVKLFFADSLERDEALDLIATIKRRSEERVKTLRAIEPAGAEAAVAGNLHPLLTLRMGIACHQGMIEVCEEFEHRLAPSGRTHS